MRRFVSLSALVALCLSALAGGFFLPPVGAERLSNVSDNLVVYWSLDEASGSRSDSVAANDLSDNNTVGSVPGLLGGSANFVAASSQYLSLSDNADISMGAEQSFSISAWVWLTSTATSQAIVSKNDVGVTARDYDIRYDSTENKYVFSIGSGSAFPTVTVGGVQTGVWQFVVSTYDASTDVASISLNGGTPVTRSSVGGAGDSSVRLTLGRESAGGSTLDLNGFLDEVAIFKRALPSGDIATLYNGGLGCAYAYVDSGCSAPTPTPTSTSAATATPTDTPTPTATSLPTVTPTPTPYPVGVSNDDIVFMFRFWFQGSEKWWALAFAFGLIAFIFFLVKGVAR